MFPVPHIDENDERLAPCEASDLVAYVTGRRGDRADEPFDVVVGGASDPATAAGLIRTLRDAGAMWWDEREIQTTPDHYRAEPGLCRVEAVPPVVD